MTFEARDSAAKVVPARLKPTTAPSSARSTPRDTRPSRKDRRAASCQTRQTAHTHSFRRLGAGLSGLTGVSRSPSAPSLVDCRSSHSSKLSPSGEFSLLSPHLLPRQAISMDCSHAGEAGLDLNSTIGYTHHDSMALDLQQWRTVVSVQNEIKKKRLLRQKTVDDTEAQKNRKSLGPTALRRSASTSTQTRGGKPGKGEICKVHRCTGSPDPSQLRPLGSSDRRSKSALRRHCSVGYSPSQPQCTSPHHTCRSGNVSPDASFARSSSPGRIASPSQPRPSTSRKSCSSGHTSPSRTRVRRPRHASPGNACSRHSCPPPERARSLSPSNPRGLSVRKTSLPSESSL